MSTRKEEIIRELRRVADALGKPSLSLREFRRNSRTISDHKVENAFGSWNKAIEAAGLERLRSDREAYTDDELLTEIIRLTKSLGRRPSEREMTAQGKFSLRPYRTRWGTFAKAYQVACMESGSSEAHVQVVREPRRPRVAVPETSPKPSGTGRRKKVQFGEPINFRGLQHAPVNEQGVVYLFGMTSKELGFLIESVRTDYPDCQGKRCVDEKRGRWEQVLIEFEHRSSNFREHGHNPQECDVIVCWQHDWPGCPIEVIELKATIRSLSKE